VLELVGKMDYGKMFSQESKLAVLESKLNIYEDLSREMLSKLESAVDKISEGNSRIASILAKHDERIEQSIRNDDLFVKLIDDLKRFTEKECGEMDQRLDKINLRLDKVDEKIQGLSNFKWQIIGVVGLGVVLLGIINAFGPTLLTNLQRPVSIEHTK
jgi:SMC interacting uncharacterized protein involved in chromosome segregation